MRIDKIVMMVKRVQYQEVVFSEAEGCNMPTDPNDLVNMCESIKQAPLTNADDDKWIQEDFEITSFDIEQSKTNDTGEG